jgi:hypothetical protein
MEIGPALVRPSELTGLPEVVARYLRFMEVVDHPRVWSFRCQWTGRFRTRPGQAWSPCRAWQYNTRIHLARDCRIRIRFGHVLPVVAHDTYAGGQGHLLAKLFDLFALEDETGPELDCGELVTYLNDAILLAPSMLLGPETHFSAVDKDCFDVSLTDCGRTVNARVLVDSQGAPRDFSTLDRFVQDPEDPEGHWRRTRWTTPVDGWRRGQYSRPLPTTGRAIWHLPTGSFTYAELHLLPRSFAVNVPPSAAS